MNWFPEKVEGKLFAMTLAICLGVSFFATQWLLSTEEDALLSQTKHDLEGLSQQHEFGILTELNTRMTEGIAVGDAILKAWVSQPSPLPFTIDFNEQGDGSKIGISPHLISSSYISPGTTISPELNRKITSVEQIFEDLAPEYLSSFRTIDFITTENICISSPPSQSSLHSPKTPFENHPALTHVQTKEQQNAKPYWTPLRLDTKSRAWISTLIIPLYHNNSLIGILASDYSFDHALSRLTPTRASEAQGRTFIVRGEDEIIIDSVLDVQLRKSFTESNHGLYLSDIADKNIHSIMEAYTGEGAPATPFMYVYNDTPRIAFIKPIAHNDWKLVVHMSTDHITDSLNSIQWKLTAGSLFIAFLLMLLIRDAFHRLFLKRILELEQAARDYVTNEEFVIPNPGKDEIGQLAFSFQELIHSLEVGKTRISEQSKQLESETEERLHAVESLEESETKFRTLFEKSSDAIMLIDGEQCVDCNGAAVALFQLDSKETLLSTSLLKLAPALQTDGETSQDDWLHRTNLAFKRGKYHFEWQIQTLANDTIWVDSMLTVIPYQGRDIIHAVIRNITDRKNEEMERVRLTTAIEQAAESIMVTDTTGEILYVNPAFEEQNQYTRMEMLSNNSSILYPESETENSVNEIHQTVLGGEVWKGKVKYKRKDGTEYSAESTISPVRDTAQHVINFVYVSRDVSKEISMELQLRQAQKMEAIGELASGIAHEINTPTQYIGDNIRFFRDSFGDLQQLLEEYGKFLTLENQSEASEKLVNSVQAIIDSIDLAYLQEEIPMAIDQSLDGNTRVAEIIRAMKEFAHPGAEERISIDINHSIKNTISVARNEWKYVAEIETNLAPDLPLLSCYAGSLNQVILNLVVNASHAIADTLTEGGTDKGTITISTSYDTDWLEIRIGDTGCGIPDEIRSKIFDPFFTTKEIGKGTGQGLSIAHSVIVEKHQGSIEIESEVGKGTTFIIKVPLENEQD